MAYLVRIQRQRAQSTTRGWQVPSAPAPAPAKVDNSYGHRMLTFDNYEVMPLAELGGKA